MPRIAALIGINMVSCLLVAGSTQTQIRDIRITSEFETTRVLIELNASFKYNVSRAENPNRMYIDFAETAIAPTVPRRIPSGDRLVSQVHASQSQKSSTRVVLDLYPEVRHRIDVFADPPRLEIELSGAMNPGPRGAGLPLAQIPPPGTTPTQAPISRPPDESNRLRIPRVSQAPRLEDFLNGTPRESEVRVTGFRQRSPRDGEPISRDTSAYLSYDEQNLYVVFVCDEEPNQVRAHMAKRENIDLDDSVAVYLDTFRDRRRAYVLATNPLGVQRDGIITEGQRNPDYNFDTLWYSRGQFTENGFVVWIAIPFKSLRFGNHALQTWGIALGRSIIRTGEDAYWPYVTDRIEGFVQQMGTLDGLEKISPAHNLQMVPYGTFTRSRTLNPAGPDFHTVHRERAGMDAKIGLGNAFALDLTLNPDFSEVESDDPQVLINQRYEVFFPEKRPFFIENAAFFQTPENLFFSRRITDPEFGGRLTGKVGSWALGALVSDDRAPGRQVAPGEPGFGERAIIGAVRIQREIGNQSTIGLFATDRDFGRSFNRNLALDTRLKISPNWVVMAQAIRSFDRGLDGARFEGSEYLANISRSGRHFTSVSSYLDRSPAFNAPLGFIQRVDIRQISQYQSYYWKPKNGPVIAFGPSATVSVDWNRKGQLRDWSGLIDFSIFFRTSQLQVSRTEFYELFQFQHLRQHGSFVSFAANPKRWMGIGMSYNQGAGAEYYPPAGIAPFVANSRDVSAGLTLRPWPRLRFDETYLYSGLLARSRFLERPGNPPAILNNHISRSKVNYQFTRALSLRAILDYNGVLPNPSLIAQQRSKRVTGDVLLTYLLNPGTALYIGYNDRFENLDIQQGPPLRLMQTRLPGMSTGRQFFIKVSYLIR